MAMAKVWKKSSFGAEANGLAEALLEQLATHNYPKASRRSKNVSGAGVLGSIFIAKVYRSIDLGVDASH